MKDKDDNDPFDDAWEDDKEPNMRNKMFNLKAILFQMSVLKWNYMGSATLQWID